MNNTSDNANKNEIASTKPTFPGTLTYTLHCTVPNNKLLKLLSQKYLRKSVDQFQINVMKNDKSIHYVNQHVLIKVLIRLAGRFSQKIRSAPIHKCKKPNSKQ